MSKETPKISWTLTDEGPMLATFSLLPIIRTFAQASGIEVDLRDISVAGRIIANFPDNLTEEQKIPDYLTQLVRSRGPRRPTSSSCRTSALPFLSCKARSRSFKTRDTISPTTPKKPRTTQRRPFRRGLPWFSARRSTRYFVKATPIAGRRPR
jgi:isocitrate dehydrogenase